MSSNCGFKYRKVANNIIDLVRKDNTPYLQSRVIDKLKELQLKITRRNVLDIMCRLYPNVDGTLRGVLTKIAILYADSEPPKDSEEYVVWLLTKMYFAGDYTGVLKEMEVQDEFGN